MKRERVKRAIQHKQVDIIPHNAEFTVELSEKLARYLNIQIGISLRIQVTHPEVHMQSF